ncbi:MAG: hypothetical protein QOE61_870, partial [Micromonosporaceae bacterium]|nr:hypothetical protein [Micromonosporaceae bacterium]
GASLANVRCPALIVAGTLDPDWANPQAEVDGIVAGMPAGIATGTMLDGAGHYPHVQFPGQVTGLLLPFLKEHARA